jgi:hypothetical protein
LPVAARRRVLTDNTFWHVRWDHINYFIDFTDYINYCVDHINYFIDFTDYIDYCVDYIDYFSNYFDYIDCNRLHHLF